MKNQKPINNAESQHRAGSLLLFIQKQINSIKLSIKRFMPHVLGVAVIIENPQGKILMLLRDDKPTISNPNHWSLPGGKVEFLEKPEVAAHRELLEEIGVDIDLTLWKRYGRPHPPFIVDQYIYLGKIDLPIDSLTLGGGQDMKFFGSHELKGLKIAFEFDILLDEYFQNPHSD